MNYLLLSNLPLGLDGIKILLHLLNFAILMLGLTFLLYKPVLKFMKKRQDTIKAELDKNEVDAKNNVILHEQYASLIENADKEINDKKVLAEKVINEHKENVLSLAKTDAANIKVLAQEEIAVERQKAVENLHSEVASIALDIASTILGREISDDEDDKIIDASLKQWSEND